MSDTRRLHCHRLSSILLVIYMIIIDQVNLSDTFQLGSRSSYLSRHRRAEYHRPRGTRSAFRQTSRDGDDNERHFVTRSRPRSTPRHYLPQQLLRQLQTAATEDIVRVLFPDQVEGDDNVDGTDEMLGQERSEVSKRDELGQEGRDSAEVKGSRSDGRRQLDNFVSLDTRGDFELFWDVDSVTEMIQFRLVANVDKEDLLAFGFSAYGEPQDADFCVMWTNRHGRHFFQVVTTATSLRRLD